MRWRMAGLPLAAAIIWGACEYKLAQKYEPPQQSLLARGALMRAPTLEGQDADNRFFRLSRYVGRQAFFVAFFERDTGVRTDPYIAQLLRDIDAVQQQGFRVICVSSALPQQNRKADLPREFVCVTDVEPLFVGHRRWGAFDENTERPIASVYFVDRAGNVSGRDGLPIPLKNPLVEMRQLLKLPP